MSKEFEEIVLKKLDSLEAKTSKTDKIIEDVILKKLDSLEDKTSKTDRIIEEVVLKKLEKLDALDERTKNTDKELKATQEIVKNLNDNFTVFDYEINRKIDTLFDAIKANEEKHDVFHENIVSLNTKIFNHDIRISVLEDYTKNEKLFATN